MEKKKNKTKQLSLTLKTGKRYSMLITGISNYDSTFFKKHYDVHTFIFKGKTNIVTDKKQTIYLPDNIFQIVVDFGKWIEIANYEVAFCRNDREVKICLAYIDGVNASSIDECLLKRIDETKEAYAMAVKRYSKFVQSRVIPNKTNQ